VTGLSRATDLAQDQHGTTRTYQSGCRCDACKAARAEKDRERSAQRKAAKAAS
jgi:hypothetical protein